MDYFGPAVKNSIDQHQNTTYAGLASVWSLARQHMLCFGAGLCSFFQQGA